mgnify:CR=1 FL=1
MNSITNPFFSVIMPIYKVEPYLSKCIDSVLAQSFANFELILVDDGSPDSCPQICDAYAALDSRISVIHKPNGGLADARNIGLTVMAGSLAKKNDDGYVIFIDSDDYFCNNNTFQQIYNRIQSFKEEVVSVSYTHLTLPIHSNKSIIESSRLKKRWYCMGAR